MPLRKRPLIDAVRFALPTLALIFASAASYDDPGAMSWWQVTGVSSATIQGSLCTFRLCISGTCQSDSVLGTSCSASSQGCSSAVTAYKAACVSGSNSGITTAVFLGISIVCAALAYFTPPSERRHHLSLRLACIAAAAATGVALVFVAYASSELKIYLSWYVSGSSASWSWTTGLILAALTVPLAFASALAFASVSLAAAGPAGGDSLLLWGQQQPQQPTIIYVQVPPGSVPPTGGYPYQPPPGSNVYQQPPQTFPQPGGPQPGGYQQLYQPPPPPQQYQ